MEQVTGPHARARHAPDGSAAARRTPRRCCLALHVALVRAGLVRAGLDHRARERGTVEG